MSEKPLMAKDPAATTAPVVVVVESVPAERVSTATHLRKSGFDVIEAADGDEARGVVDSVAVNVVFADLATPGQTNGSALLRWLRERHPAVKVIVTSDTEMAAPDGYGIFLSKPYRPVDLDYCLRKVLAGARAPARETGSAATAKPAVKRSPEQGQAQGKARPNTPSAPGKADGRDDEIPDPSLAELSRRLGERAARQRAVDPADAKAERRAALQAYDQARVRRLRLGLGFAVAAGFGSAIVYLVLTVGPGAVLLSPRAMAPEPASLLSIAAATPTPAPPDAVSPASAPSPAPNAADTPAVVPAAAQTAAAADSQQAPADPAPNRNRNRLRRDEAREVQARLRSFGFNPGTVDGAPGAMTEGAVMRYQQNRGLPQTGKVDRDLLEQLRQDPAPQVAQRAARPPSPAARRSDPFEPVRAAGDRLGQWLDSLVR